MLIGVNYPVANPGYGVYTIYDILNIIGGGSYFEVGGLAHNDLTGYFI